MPKRMPRELWRIRRAEVWKHDEGKCVHCGIEVDLDKCQIDHISRHKPLDNRLPNLRTLCKVCHALRLDSGHRGLTGRLLQQGLLPANWRELVWE